MNRTYCGLVNNKLVSSEVLVKGWVKKNRNLGKLVFLDVADRSGLVQVVFDENNSFFNDAKNLKRESVVEINGIVEKRKSVNGDYKNGDIEIIAKDLKIDSVAKTTPLIIEDETDALEEIRMNYRYLDLRRPIMQRNLIFRSKIVNAIRQFLVENNFIEIETPILGKPTPEGARDYLVPSRIHKGNFYALPQSPQIYKQLLMVAGMDRYFQIAKCFRDEDLRSDRQPEFTQLDMELSFTDELEIQAIIESLFKKVFKDILNIDLKIPFEKMDYEYAINNYGSDKPDLRFDMKLIDVTEIFKNSELSIFKDAKINNHVIKCIISDKILNKTEINDLEKYAKDMKAKGLAWISFDGNQISGPIANYVNKKIVEDFLIQHNKGEGTILFVVDKLEIANNALGLVRSVLGEILCYKKANVFKFAWIVNWPLFEYDEETKQFSTAHHPFTQPQDKFHSTFDTNKEKALAKAYDIVLNGYELGGGSIRITDPQMQDRMFKTLGLSQEEIQNKFGYLLDSFTYGVPPHGGIALGIDRLIAILLNLENIKEVIAFPKNANAFDAMLKAPSVVNEEDLKELHISISKK